MTTIAEKRDDAAERVKRLKASKVAEWHEEGRPELHPTLVGWRGAEEVVVMISMTVDRDEGLRAAWIAATGFGCDALAVSFDVWGTTERVNPVTGKPWGPREMQDVVDHHQGIERGWIDQGLNTLAVNRAGDVAAGWDAYVTHHRVNGLGIHRWELEWGASRRSDPEDGLDQHTGVIVANLLAYMKRPTMQQDMARRLGISGRDFGLDDVEAQAHSDCAVVKAVIGAGVWQGGLMLAGEDPRRWEIIQESLGAYAGWARRDAAAD